MKIEPIFLKDDELDTLFREVHNGGKPPLTKKDLAKALAQTEISQPYFPKTLELGTFKEALRNWAMTKDRSEEQGEWAREMIRLAKRRNQLAITVDFSFDAKWDPELFVLATRKLAEYLFLEKHNF